MAKAELLKHCFTCTLSELEPLFNEAFQSSRSRFTDKICFFIPGIIRFNTSFYKTMNPYRFPSISVTGDKCYLNCEHCKGRMLEAMIPAKTPEKLMDVCQKIEEEGGKGCLISGGSMTDGSVPLMRFVPTIKRVKHDLGLDIVVHTGIVNPHLAEALAKVEIDAAMIDVVGSDETMRSVCHLNLKLDAFDRSLSLLEHNNIPIVPHIVVGIHYGELRGEGKALQIISKHNPAAVVIVALNPLNQTPMKHVVPPSPLDISRVILATRFMIPRTPSTLGCARPMGKHRSETETLAIRAGVNGIAYPSEKGYHFAKKLGLDIRFSEECCALVYRKVA